jgi:O-antigen/teichoic acid export membrane protein
MIIFCSIALWGNLIHRPFQIEWYVYIQTISYLITAFIALIFVYSKAGFIRLQFSRPIFLMILKNSYPFAILTLLMSLYTRIDSVMLERLLPDPTGKIQAGIYASAYRMLDALNMIAFLFGTLLLPIFSRMLQQKQDVKPLVNVSFKLFFFPSLIVVMVCFFYSQQIMTLLYHHCDAYTARIFALLMMNFVCIGTVYIFGTLLTANANLSYLNRISAIGMIFNILLNIIFILKYQAMGAVVATIITQFVISLLQAIKAASLFKIHISFKSFLFTALFLIILAGTGLLATKFISSWIAGALLMAVAGIFVAFSFRLLHFRVLVREILSR